MDTTPSRLVPVLPHRSEDLYSAKLGTRSQGLECSTGVILKGLCRLARRLLSHLRGADKLSPRPRSVGIILESYRMLTLVLSFLAHHLSSFTYETAAGGPTKCCLHCTTPSHRESRRANHGRLFCTIRRLGERPVFPRIFAKTTHTLAMVLPAVGRLPSIHPALLPLTRLI